MCGIAGVITKNAISSNILEEMSRVLRHRGPDDEGYYMQNNEGENYYSGTDTIASLNLPRINNQTFNIGLMHRRLSILDLSELGHQPMSSDCNRFVMVYNGEVYNYKELREELIGKGHIFKSNSDTEVILNAYKEWGRACFSKFNGMWALAILDKEKKELLLSRDRFGIKPLYYYLDEGSLVFASEIKAFYCYEGSIPKVNQEEVINYIFYGTTSEKYTNLYQNINDLPPSTSMVYSLVDGSVSYKEYYVLEDNLGEIGKEDIVQKSETIFQETITAHLRSDVEVGACLSGGLDSSLITWYTANNFKEKSLKTFTASYPGFKDDETSYAKAVTSSIKTVDDFYTTPTSDGLLNDIGDLLHYQDLPIGSSTIYAQWEVMKLASKHKIKVLLDGQGADEVLGGYAAYGGHYLIDLLKGFRISKFMKEYSALKQNFSPKINQQLLRAFSYSLPSVLQNKLRGTQRISSSILTKEAYQSVVNNVVVDRGGVDFIGHSLKSVQYGMYDLLRYEDRNSMAFSIESRVPFLDHHLVEFLMNLPIDYKFNNGWSKFIFRKMLQNKLPDEVVWRKYKKGFITPQEQWKTKTISFFLTYFQSCKLPDYIDRESLLVLGKSLEDNANHLTEFWRIFSVIKWLEDK